MILLPLPDASKLKPCELLPSFGGISPSPIVIIGEIGLAISKEPCEALIVIGAPAAS